MQRGERVGIVGRVLPGAARLHGRCEPAAVSVRGPVPHGVEVLVGSDAEHAGHGRCGRRRVGGADDHAALVDPDGAGDIDELVEAGDGMAAVDERRVGRFSALDERARRFCAGGVKRDGDDGEGVSIQLFVQ